MKKAKRDKSVKTYSLSDEERDNLRGRREVLRIEKYKHQVLIDGIENDMHAIVEESKKRNSIPAEKMVEVDIDKGTLIVREEPPKKEETQDGQPTG